MTDVIKCWYCGGTGIGSYFEPCNYCNAMSESEKENI